MFFDTVRGIVAGSDKALYIDTDIAQQTADWIDPLSSGFTATGAAWNTNGTYLSGQSQRKKEFSHGTNKNKRNRRVDDRNNFPHNAQEDSSCFRTNAYSGAFRRFGADPVMESAQADTTPPYEFSFRSGVEQDSDGNWITVNSVGP